MWLIGSFKNLLGIFEERRLACTDDGDLIVTTTGASGLSKDRIQALSAVTTRQRITWPAGEGPTAIIAYCKGGATDEMKFCVNAETPEIANAWLAQTADGTFNLNHKRILPGTDVEQRTYTFKAPLTSVDFLPVTGHTEFGILGV